VDVRQVLLDQCGSYTTHTLILRMFDEKTQDAVNGTVWITLEAYTDAPLRNYSFMLPTNTTFHICMDGTSSFHVNSTAEYSSLPAYAARFYYLVDAELSGTASITDMYLLNTTYDDTVTYTIKDIDGNELGGRLLKVLRYYPANNTYKLVAMGLTNDDGTVALNLEKYYATYSYIVDFKGALIQAFDSEIVNADTRTLTIGAALRNLFWKYYGKVSSVCVFDNTTNYLSCTVTDSSNKLAGGTLAVYKRGATMWNNTCLETTTGAAFTLNCYLDDNVTGNTYYWELRGSIYDSDSGAYTTALLDSGYIQQGMRALYGAIGLLVVIFLVMAVTLLGAYNPAVAIILNVVVLSISYMVGLLAVSELAIIGVIALAAIIVFKLKT